LVGFFVFTLAAAPVYAAAPDAGKRWDVELFGGSAYNFRTNLKIEQAGQPDIDFRARYETKPFTEAPYYVWRVGKWSDDHGWELEWIHHKIYLDNNPPDVQNFEVSHGYNMFVVNRAQRHGDVIYRYGVGPVIAHTESTIRGLEHDTGYDLAGAALQIAAERRFPLSEKWFAAVEGKLTAAYARVDVADGKATVPNVALHAIVGIGRSF